MNDIENLEGWRHAAAKEINQLEDKGCWKECQKSEANQADRKSFPALGYSESSAVPLAKLSRRKPAFAYEAIA